MIIDKYGRVAGSIDLARVAELFAETDDEDLKAHYLEVLGDSEEGQSARAAKPSRAKAAEAKSEAKATDQSAAKAPTAAKKE